MGKCGRDDGSSKEGMIEAVCNEMKLGRQRDGWKELHVRQAEETGEKMAPVLFLAVQAAEQQRKKIRHAFFFLKERLHACRNLTA